MTVRIAAILCDYSTGYVSPSDHHAPVWMTSSRRHHHQTTRIHGDGEQGCQFSFCQDYHSVRVTSCFSMKIVWPPLSHTDQYSNLATPIGFARFLSTRVVRPPFSLFTCRHSPKFFFASWLENMFTYILHSNETKWMKWAVILVIISFLRKKFSSSTFTVLEKMMVSCDFSLFFAESSIKGE